MTRKLGRLEPTDWRHVERYPLTAESLPAKPVPVTVGVNWYADFDAPVKHRDGHWWVGRNVELGRIRGGHCVCVPSGAYTDADSWYEFYDQGQEGACVGFGTSRTMSHLNRRRYMARWLWDRAKEQDEWPDTNPGDANGTSVRAAHEVLRARGHVWYKSYLAQKEKFPATRAAMQPSLEDGIAAYRWATTVEQMLTALQTPAYERIGAIPFLNSWGSDYPRRVWMPLEVWSRLIDEGGEVALITDR